MESTTRNPDVWVDSEVDLRHYIYVVSSWWREIVFFAVIAVVLITMAIIAMRLILPPQYIAAASVALVRTSTDVTLDERFRTTADVLGENATSLMARRNALLGLVNTGTIAQEVINKLGGLLDDHEKKPASLMAMVSARYSSETASSDISDLIVIEVNADKPEKAAAIANSWAESYIREVNRIYGQVPNQVIESINAELMSTEQAYLVAQEKLTQFIANNRIDELNARLSIIRQRVNQEVALQQALMSRWQQTQEQLTTVQALRSQIENGGNGAVRSTMAALQILKLAVYGMSPEQIQIEVRDIPEITLEEMLVDVDGLITSLNEQLAQLNEQIATDTDIWQSESPQAHSLQETLTALRKNQALLEEEQSRQKQLIQQRDVFWQAFQALSGKASELNLARAAASSEVRLGANAVPPNESTKRVSLVMSIFVAGLAGLSFGLFYALFADFMNKQPFLSRSQSR